MARAALSVVYAHARDERSPPSALAWRGWSVPSRTSAGSTGCGSASKSASEDSHNYDYIFNKVSELLVWPIEQQRWGMRESVFSAYQEEVPGLLNFHSAYDVEHTLLVMLANAMQDAELHPIEYYMREVEDDLVLPRGSLARLPADSEFR